MASQEENVTGKQAKWILAAAVALFIVRVGLYIALIPPNEMPDELAHFEQIRYMQHMDDIVHYRLDAKTLAQEIRADYLMMRHGLDQRPDPSRMRDHLTRFHRQVAYYWVMGRLVDWLGLDSNPAAWYFCRAMSMFMGAVVIVLAFFTARLIAPRRPIVAAATAAFLALLPQFGALSAVITTDKPAEAAGAVFFLLLVVIARRPNPRAWIGVAIIILLLPVIKKTAFYFVLLAALAAVPWWRSLLARGRWGRYMSWALPSGAAGLFLAATFWPPLAALAARLMGMPIVRLWIDGSEPEVLHQVGMIDMVAQAIRPLDPVFWQHLYLNLASLFKSAWAVFGYLNLPVGQGWYLGAGLVTLLAAAGWARLLYRPQPEWLMESWQGRAFGLLAAGVALTILVVLIRQVVFIPGSLIQGRYIFPGLVPLAVLGSVGYLALWPERWQKPALAAMLAFVAAMDLAGMWRAITPYYYYVSF